MLISLVGKDNGKLSAVYFDDDYEAEFHGGFSFCFKEYGEYPPSRLFNGLSKIDESVYRGKYTLSWGDIVKKYGYIIDNSFKSESMLLNLISSVTGCNYVSQKII